MKACSGKTLSIASAFMLWRHFTSRFTAVAVVCEEAPSRGGCHAVMETCVSKVKAGTESGKEGLADREVSEWSLTITSRL